MSDTGGFLSVPTVDGNAVPMANPDGSIIGSIPTVTIGASIGTQGIPVLGSDGTNAYPLKVNSSGRLQVDIVTGGGGGGGGSGTEYVEGDTSATITGTAILMEGASNTLLPVQGTVADGILVNLGSNNDVTVSGVSTATKQSDGSQKTQIVDGSGNVIGATSNALNVHIASGSSSGTEYTEDTASVTNPAGGAMIVVRDDSRTGSLTSADGDNVALRGTNSGELYVKHVDSVPASQSGTWNISNVSGTISLPTGASTDTKQDTINTSINTLLKPADTLTKVSTLDTITNVVHIDDNGASITVDGTITANLGTLNGVATSSKQPALGTSGTASTDVITIQGISGMTAVKVDGSGVTQPISASSLPLPTGASTLAEQQSQTTHLATIAGDTTAIETAVQIMDDWDESDRAKVNIIAGQAGVSAGAGAVASNTPRMTLASDDPSVTALQLLGDVVATIGSAIPTEGAAIAGTDGTNARTIKTNSSGQLEVIISGGSSSGTEYTEGNTDASITGTAILMEGASNTLLPVQGTVADGILVNLGTNNDITGTVTANAGTDLNTSALALESGGNIAGIRTALEIIDNFISGSKGLVTEDNSGAIKTSVELLDDAVAATGSAITAKGLTVVGTDGTNARALKVDSDGNLQVDVLTIPTVTIQDGGNTITVDGAVTANLGTLGGAATETKQDAIIGHVDGIEGLLTTIDADTSALAGAVSGTEVQVDIVASLPAGTNAIGKLSANSGVDIGDVDVTSAIITGGAVDHDGADSGNPIKTGARANAITSTDTLVSDGDRTDSISDLDGAKIVRQEVPLGDILSESVSNTDGASTALTNFGATASTKNYVTSYNIFRTDSGTGLIYVDFRDGTSGSVLYRVPVPPLGGANSPCNGGRPLFKTSANTALAFDVSASISTVYISVSGFKSKIS